MHFGFQFHGRKNPEGRAERIHGRMTGPNVSYDPTRELYADINKRC
jgi:ABC-type sulfate transport system substrate-binding protein